MKTSTCELSPKTRLTRALTVRNVPLMARINSRFSGTCADCGVKIAAGEPIDYDYAKRRVTCVACAPPETPAAPTVVRVSYFGAEIGFKLDGRLGSEAFKAYISALGPCRFRDGVNHLPLGRASAAIVALRAAGLTIVVDDAARVAIETHAETAKTAILSANGRANNVDAILSKFGGALYGFQREGVAWLAPRSGALVADDMGLGKTIQALTAVPDGAPVVVICPAVAKGVWQREAAKWRPEIRVSVLSGRGSFRAPEGGEMVCVNYDILPPTSEEIDAALTATEAAIAVALKSRSEGDTAKAWKAIVAFFSLGSAPSLLPGTVLIVDEAHACANSKTARTARVRALSSALREKGGACWILTATPLKNRPQELWNVLELAGLAREAYGSWKGFLRAYDGTKNRFGGYDWGTPSPEAAERLRLVSIRRCKEDVITDLPAKTHRTLPAEIDRATAKLCDAALAEITEEGEGQATLGIEKAIAKLMSTGLGFSQLSAARAALAQAKIPAMLGVVESYEEQGEPLVVFSAYRAPIDLLAKREGWAVITGDTSNERRGEIVDLFQAGALKGVGCTIRAGGVAITLTRASNVLRVDREWNPSLNVQAEDRCYRIGQKNAVLVTDLVANHVLDEMIARTIARKEAIVSRSVNASTVQHVAPEAAIVIDWEIIEADAAKAAREAAEATKLAAAAQGEATKRRAERKASEARREAQKRVRASAARRLGEIETEEDAARRGPSSEIESWAIAGLRQLAEDDSDRARYKNEIGFSASDCKIGHALAWLPDLTDQEWRLVVRMARHYQGQIGEAPKVAA